MSRISRYNFGGDREKYNSILQDDTFQKDEPYDQVVAKHESEINEICLKCERNEKAWKDIKFLYRTLEFFGILTCIFHSILSLLLSILFFKKYRLVFKYIKDVGLFKFYIPSEIPLIYIILESGGLVFDFIRGLVSFRIFRIFRNEKKSKQILEKRNANDDIYSRIYLENRITIKLINNLKLRVDLKTQLKKMFHSMIRLEVLVNMYHFIFVIAPKILTASYLQLNVVNEFKGNISQTMDIDNVYGKQFDCCQTNETVCDTSLMNSQCVQDNIGNYIQLLVVIFLLTAVSKFIIQIWLVANFKLNLFDTLVNKRYVEEINMKRLYDKTRSASFSVNVKARIEENDAIMAEQLELLENENNKMPFIKENDNEVNHHYAEIR